MTHGTRDAPARYVTWLDTRRRAILGTAAALVVVCVYLAAFHLPLHAELSALLPRDVPAIRDLKKLEARLVAKDSMVAVVIAPTPDERAIVTRELVDALAGVDRSLVTGTEVDDVALRELVRAHQALFVPLGDLAATERAVTARVTAAKLAANPLYINLDDAATPETTRDANRQLDELRAKRRAAETQLDRSGYVSADGRSQLVVIDTAFRATDPVADRALQRELEAIGGRVRARHPAATVAFAGGAMQSLAEHAALVNGMALSSAATAVLVLVVLFVHLRSSRLIAVLTLNIIAATVVAFGVAAVTVGHLNAATAFVGPIVAGNGINYGILLVARYLEERRARAAPDAMACAIRGTLRPTLVASMGAAIAYGALGLTHFTGFTELALIGGAGMLVCWVASFVVLPALVLRFASDARASESPWFGRVVVRLFACRRPIAACVAGAVIAAASLAITVRYVAADPFEYDMTKLRSDAPEALAPRRWMQYVTDTFSGSARNTYLAVDDLAQVPAVVAALHDAQRRDPIVGRVTSMLDLVPPDQPAKLAILDRLRGELDAVAGDDPELAGLRPPADLRVFTASDLPDELRARLTERDGRLGYVVAVSPGPTFDESNGHDLVRFAHAIRDLPLADGARVTTSGPFVIFADIITAIRHDGVVATIAAALGLVVMVVLAVGRGRRALAVLAGAATGSLAMVACCALLGLKITFLDFVALPISLGLGIDYCVNVAHRADRDDARIALRSTGGTVLVCSLTTVIGYASLLVSSNVAIRGFGLASLIGEGTSVVAALVLVPALIATGKRRPALAAWRDMLSGA